AGIGLADVAQGDVSHGRTREWQMANGQAQVEAGESRRNHPVRPFAIRYSLFAPPRSAPYFSVSTSPRTNSLCMATTTNTGGSIASTAVAITTGHSVSASVVVIILRMPT